MIELTRLNHSTFVLNSDLIEQLRASPDTVVTLTSGENIIVLDTPQQIVSKIRDFRRSVLTADPVIVTDTETEAEARGKK